MKLKDAVRTFLTALDEKRAVTSNIHIGAYIDVLHAYKCPATRHGKSRGPCNCGGDEQKLRIDNALEAMREASK